MRRGRITDILKEVTTALDDDQKEVRTSAIFTLDQLVADFPECSPVVAPRLSTYMKNRQGALAAEDVEETPTAVSVAMEMLSKILRERSD